MDMVRVDEHWFNAGARPIVDVFADEERSKDGKEVVGQKSDRDSGRLKWRIEFPFKDQGARKAEMVTVVVLADVLPDIVGETPVFAGVWARKWHMARDGGDAASGLAYAADSFSTLEAKPSTKRAAVKADDVPAPPVPVMAGAKS